MAITFEKRTLLIEKKIVRFDCYIKYERYSCRVKFTDCEEESNRN